MLLIVTYFLSLFSDFYIADSHQTGYGLELEVFCKGQKRGYIAFKNNGLTYYWQYGFKGIKGFSLYKNVRIEYKNEKLILLHKESGKEIFNMKCTPEQYERIAQFIPCSA